MIKAKKGKKRVHELVFLSLPIWLSLLFSFVFFSLFSFFFTIIHATTTTRFAYSNEMKNRFITKWLCHLHAYNAHLKCKIIIMRNWWFYMRKLDGLLLRFFLRCALFLLYKFRNRLNARCTNDEEFFFFKSKTHDGKLKDLNQSERKWRKTMASQVTFYMEWR